MPPVDRRDRLIAAALLVGGALLYGSNLCPGVFVGDAPELVAAAATFGVPHPPGYPLFTMLAGLFVRLLPVGEVAWRANLFSALCGAGTAALLYLLARRLGAGRLAAVAGASGLLAGRAFLASSLALEVYTFDALLLVATLSACHRAGESSGRGAWVAAGLAFGLLVGHRPTNLALLPALLLLVEPARRRSGAPVRRYLLAAAALAATGLVFAYLPLTCRRDPGLCIGEPTGWGRLLDVITAKPYYRHFATGTTELTLLRLGAWARDLWANAGLLAVAAITGLAACVRARRAGLAAALAWILVVNTLLGARYNILDVDAHFLPGYVTLALAAALGVGWLARPRHRAAAAAVLLCGAAALVVVNLPRESLRGYAAVERWARAALTTIPERSVVVAFGDTPHHALQYGRLVRRWGPGVAVVSGAVTADWYVDQLDRRHPDLRLRDQPGPAPADRIAHLLAVAPARPVFLTLPLELAAAGSPRAADLVRRHCSIPAGALFRLWPAEQPLTVEEVLGWNQAADEEGGPARGPDDQPQVLEQRLAAVMRRFALAAALVQQGRLDDARSRLEAVVAADPDRTEVAIAQAYERIGVVRRPLDMGRRSRAALSRLAAGPATPGEVLAILAGQTPRPRGRGP